MKSVISLLTGIMFGAGLCISGMVNPASVIGFLDVSGSWDPSLALVLAGGLTVMFVANLIAKKMNRPVYAEYWRLPTKDRLDVQLILGSAVFGIGWGVGGFCPGPALTSIAYSNSTLLLGVAAYIMGVVISLIIKSILSTRNDRSVANA